MPSNRSPSKRGAMQESPPAATKEAESLLSSPIIQSLVDMKSQQTLPLPPQKRMRKTFSKIAVTSMRLLKTVSQDVSEEKRVAVMKLKTLKMLGLLKERDEQKFLIWQKANNDVPSKESSEALLRQVMKTPPKQRSSGTNHHHNAYFVFTDDNYFQDRWTPRERRDESQFEDQFQLPPPLLAPPIIIPSEGALTFAAVIVGPKKSQARRRSCYCGQSGVQSSRAQQIEALYPTTVIKQHLFKTASRKIRRQMSKFISEKEGSIQKQFNSTLNHDDNEDYSSSQESSLATPINSPEQSSAVSHERGEGELKHIKNDSETIFTSVTTSGGQLQEAVVPLQKLTKKKSFHTVDESAQVAFTEAVSERLIQLKKQREIERQSEIEANRKAKLKGVSKTSILVSRRPMLVDSPHSRIIQTRAGGTSIFPPRLSNISLQQTKSSFSPVQRKSICNYRGGDGPTHHRRLQTYCGDLPSLIVKSPSHKQSSSTLGEQSNPKLLTLMQTQFGSRKSIATLPGEITPNLLGFEARKNAVLHRQRVEAQKVLNISALHQMSGEGEEEKGRLEEDILYDNDGQTVQRHWMSNLIFPSQHTGAIAAGSEGVHHTSSFSIQEGSHIIKQGIIDSQNLRLNATMHDYVDFRSKEFTDYSKKKISLADTSFDNVAKVKAVHPGKKLGAYLSTSCLRDITSSSSSLKLKQSIALISSQNLDQLKTTATRSSSSSSTVNPFSSTKSLLSMQLSHNEQQIKLELSRNKLKPTYNKKSLPPSPSINRTGYRSIYTNKFSFPISPTKIRPQ